MLGFIWGKSSTPEDIALEEHEKAVEFIEKLTTRLKSSTFIDDRRSAMLSLKAYSEKYPLVNISWFTR